ncbi:MAG: valine--tRNA ligase, partial [Planctomycetaceae bacterium]|nr:valine--tRNA ligase [Planctomycetaceae bacterium]
MTELPKQYEHKEAQLRWSRFWDERGFFNSDPPREDDPNPKQPFTIVIPPPNVTGALHLGHALNNTLQDIVIRMKRMQGFETLWVPGVDHAGIATQAVVERRLLDEEGKTRHDIGREALVARIWAWKDQYQARIISQLKEMGCSCDWRRTRFTLDEMCAKAVRHFFFGLFREKLIYRGKRLVNWDTHLQTAVSDDEVFHETVDGHFWYIKYEIAFEEWMGVMERDLQEAENEKIVVIIEKESAEPELLFADGRAKPRYVIVATTRPETMLGDTAVAVHPDPEAALDKAIDDLKKRIATSSEKEKADLQQELEVIELRKTDGTLARLKGLAEMARQGCHVVLPLLNKKIPLVLDEWAKPEKGTGCVKITPAHDPNDYEVGVRQDLPMVNILNKDGTLNENAGPYAGLTIKQARAKVVADLEASGQLVKVEERIIELAHSDRSKTPIEPYLNDQWFVKMDTLAQSAMDSVTQGDVQITPSRYAKTYLDWLGEKRDWPIGRQLWWGHQIPIWYCRDVRKDEEDKLKQAFAGRENIDIFWQWDEENLQWWICSQDEDLAADAVPGYTLVREEDVLDTWFSSALWPHSTLGWPDETPEMAYYYPTNVLITSRDIITLWVARMVLAGRFNTNAIPFHDVYIHPKILDKYGETMSKMKGNGIDPVKVIDKFGADSLRFAMAHMCTESQDVRLPLDFECPHCQTAVEQTKKNRILPRVECPKCKKEFSTQWAEKPEDKQLPAAQVVGERFEVARNFCNKLWNAARFVMMSIEGETLDLMSVPQQYSRAEISMDLRSTEFSLNMEDRWILSRLNTVIKNATESLKNYQFANVARELYDFAWDEFCSFYIEITKSRLNDATMRKQAQHLLAYVLSSLIRLLHPVIPFVTEEIWQHLRECDNNLAESITIAPWPECDTSAMNPT